MSWRMDEEKSDKSTVLSPYSGLQHLRNIRSSARAMQYLPPLFTRRITEQPDGTVVAWMRTCLMG